MRKKTEVIALSKFHEYEKTRREIVERRFNDSRLWELFKLTPKAAIFAREYALSNNGFQASRIAGYSEKTTRKNTSQMIRKTVPAVKMIKEDIVNIGVEFRAGLSEYLASGLLEIFEKRNSFPGAAVYAARELRRIFIENNETETENKPVETHFTELQQEQQLEAITEEFKKMGIYG